MSKETKAVATTPKNKAVSTTIDYGTDAGQGFENQTNSDIKLPFLNVLQSNSPQVTNDDSGKLRAGMLFNTVTAEGYDGKEGVLFVPAITKHVFLEYVPRAKGGGFRGEHNPLSPEVRKAVSSAKEFGKYSLPNGNELSENFSVFGTLLHSTGEPNMLVVMNFSSKKIKAYKDINTRVRMFQVTTSEGKKVNPPLFAHIWRITTWKDRNEKGDFFNVTVAPANGSVAKSLLDQTTDAYQAAKSVMEMVKSGIAQVDYAKADQESEVPAADPNWQKP